MKVYRITKNGRKTMHKELDRIIDKINQERYDEDFALPDLTVELTKINKKEDEETILTIGAELVENTNGTLSVEEEYIRMRIFNIIDPSKPQYYSSLQWNEEPPTLGTIIGRAVAKAQDEGWMDELVNEGIDWFAEHWLDGDDTEDYLAQCS